MADIDEIKNWCEEARKILSRFGKDGRGIMKDRNADVAKLLEQLRSVPELVDDYARMKASYERIALAAKKAAEQDNKDAVIVASRDLSLLKNELRLKLAGVDGAGKKEIKAGEKAEKKMESSKKQEWAEDRNEREKDRLQKERLENLANAILGDPQMTYKPVNATPEEILAAGLAVARAAVVIALKDRDTRTDVDIGEGREKLIEVGKAIRVAEAAATKRLQKVDYESEFSSVETDYDNALPICYLNAAKTRAERERFLKVWREWDKHVKATDWVEAKAALPELQSASIDLYNAGYMAVKEKDDFDLAIPALLRLAEARLIDQTAPKAWVNPALTGFRADYKIFNDAKLLGDFGVAKGKISELQIKIDALIAADEKRKLDKTAFEDQQKLIADLEVAQALAKSKSPAVASAEPAFTLAYGKVDEQVAKLDWAAAKALLPALKSATETLLRERGSFNSGYTTEQKNELQRKLLVLEPRTDLAKPDGPTPHIKGLQAAVKDLRKCIDDAVSGSDHATAELLLSQLSAVPGPIGTMEKAIEEYKQHKIKFDGANNGAVKTARAVALTPVKLAGERDKALDATAARIKRFADKGSVVTKADPMVVDWVKEAEAWMSAQEASDNLNSDTVSDPGKLRALANLPGGGKVFDALIAGMPEGRPEAFLKDAISIRYGVNVKRFQKKNANVQDETGLAPIAPTTPDKSLKKMYQLFGQVPLGNVKGKVAELIQFDQDDGGAAALGSTGEIWMYCGLPAGGSKQTFGNKSGVVPDGEFVDPDFVPTNEDELPYFDFAALHEVGHVIDHKQGVMTRPEISGLAGWQTHTSDEVAAVAAAHFKYDLDFVKAVLSSATSTPPTVDPPPKSGTSQPDWDEAREKVLNWCQSVRVGMEPWFDAALCKHVAINGRVYQESYDNNWTSYMIAARSKGLTPYQFRSPVEWFAELYAGYFSKKLAKNHPYAEWLKPLKKVA